MIRRFHVLLFSLSVSLFVHVVSPHVHAGMFGLGERLKSHDMQKWIESVWPEARARGISKELYGRVTKGLTPDNEIFKIVDNQAEFIKPVGLYISKAVSDERVRVGFEKKKEEAGLLNALERKYGVPREILLAIWGLESAYGEVKGDKSVLRSTATLGFKGQRQKFGKNQFLASLEILQKGETTPDKLKGSWAGAMGHTQFIPTTYLKHAVDYDGDGRRNIWQSHADALASTANYVSNSGWVSGGPCFHEITLPRSFNYLEAGRNKKKSVGSWKEMGLKRADGGVLRDLGAKAAVILPSGASGPAFMIFDNFYAVLAYNQATSYVLAVCNLAGKLRGKNMIKSSWPDDVVPLNTLQKRELQELLKARGFYKYDPDGLLGPLTRTALQKWQKENGMVPDGYPHQKLLLLIRNSK